MRHQPCYSIPAPSPEAVYSQLNITTGGDTRRKPVPSYIPLPPNVSDYHQRILLFILLLMLYSYIVIKDSAVLHHDHSLHPSNIIWGLHHSKPLTLSCDKLSTKEENKKDEMSSSTLHRQNSQKVKMTILHNDRIKITPTSQRPSVTPQHCAVTPPDYTHKQTHSPTSEEQPFIALNDEPSFVADYDRLRSNS